MCFVRFHPPPPHCGFAFSYGRAKEAPKGGFCWSLICSCPVGARASDLGVLWTYNKDERIFNDITSKGAGKRLEELRLRGIGRRKRGFQGD